MAGTPRAERAKPNTPLPFPEVPGVEVQHRFVRARGLLMHVATAGPIDAPSLVMLHGWPQHWYVWRRTLPELAPLRRCVMIDLRGLGWSEAPPAGYTKQTLAEDVCAVLDELGIERTAIVGHDWGGWVAFLIALESPQRVDRMLALNIVPPWPPRRSARPRVSDLMRLAYQPLLATPWLGETLLRRTGLIGAMLRADNVHSGTFSAQDAECFAAVLREPERARASSLYYRDWLRQEFGPFMRGRYSPQDLKVPAHLLYGVHDGALGPEPPQADGLLSVEPVQDSGHFIAEERPDLVAARALELAG